MAESGFNWALHHERCLPIKGRTATEVRYAVPVERQMDFNPRLLHEALAAAFLIAAHRAPPESLALLRDAEGKPRLDKIRAVLREHASKIRSMLASSLRLQSVRLPVDYVERRTEHDLLMFSNLLESKDFQKAILEAASIRKHSIPLIKRTKNEAWGAQAPRTPRRRGRPAKKA
jgi:hypothetical protein